MYKIGMENSFTKFQLNEKVYNKLVKENLMHKASPIQNNLFILSNLTKIYMFFLVRSLQTAIHKSEILSTIMRYCKVL